MFYVVTTSGNTSDNDIIGERCEVMYTGFSRKVESPRSSTTDINNKFFN